MYNSRFQIIIIELASYIEVNYGACKGVFLSKIFFFLMTCLFIKFRILIIYQLPRYLVRSISTTLRLNSNGPWFALNDEQKEIQATARKFAREVIAPAAAQFDKTGEYPWEIYKKAWSLGLPLCAIPAHCGGLELSNLATCLVNEEFGWGYTVVC